MSIFRTIAELNGSSLTYLFLGAVTFFETLAIVGFALPGTTLFIFAGVLCSRGFLRLEYVIPTLAVAGAIGSTVSYFLGKLGGEWIKKQKIFREGRLLKAERYFQRYGEWSVLVSQFIGPLRPLMPLVAGIFKTHKKSFLIVNTLSAFGAAIFYVSLGFFFGRRWLLVVRVAQHWELPLVLVSLCLFIIVLLRRRRRGH